MNYIDKFIKMALEEDLGVVGDLTTDSIFSDEHVSEGKFSYREESVVGGICFAKRVFEILDNTIQFEIIKKDGDFVNKNEVVALIKGKTKTILKGERLALNLLQRISGIATNTKKYVDKVSGYNVKVVDTRKTTPLFRYFEKYGVKIGGGYNHRFALYDAVMIKDNHIAAAGSIKNAISMVKKNIPHTTKIEVEADTYEQAIIAMESGADIILLDNIRGDYLKKCVEILKNKVIIEASGNINLENIREIAESGVDIISVGAIIYNAKNIDIGLDF